MKKVLFFISIFVLVFILVPEHKTQAVNPGPCAVTQTLWEGAQYVTTVGSEKKLTITMNNCAGEELGVSLFAKDQSTKIFPMTGPSTTNIRVGASNKITITYQVGETPCSIYDTPDCTIRTTTQVGGSGYVTHNGTSGTLTYECDTICNKDWVTKKIEGEMSATDYAALTALRTKTNWTGTKEYSYVTLNDNLVADSSPLGPYTKEECEVRRSEKSKIKNVSDCVKAVQPTITSFTPETGEYYTERELAIAGTNLDTINSVSVEGASGSFVIQTQTPTTLKVKVPKEHQKTGKLIVSNGIFSAKSTKDYVVNNTTRTDLMWYYSNVNHQIIGKGGGIHDAEGFATEKECNTALTAQKAKDTAGGITTTYGPCRTMSKGEAQQSINEDMGAVSVSSVEKPYNSDYNLLAPIGGLNTIDKKTSIGDYLNIIFKIAIGLMGALAVIMIVIHGIQYMGDESVFGKTEAKHSIMTTIGGLLLALCAYALLNTINPDLLGGDGVYVEPVTIQVRNSYEERLSRTQKTDVVFKRSKYYDDIKKFVNNSSYTGHPKKIHHCLLQVAIQRESDSGKTFEVVGHDEDVAGPRGSIKARDVFIDSGKKFNGVTFAAGDSKLQIDSSHLNSDHGNKTIYSAPNPSADDLGLDWRFSHSVGILGETLFPLNESNRGQTYKQGIITSITKKRILPIKKIFDPATVIEVATEKMQFNFSRPSCNGDIEKTYRAYGSGNCNYKGTPGDFLNREAPLRKNLYDQCLAQDK